MFPIGLLLAFFMGIAQSSFISPLRLGGASPDLVLLFVVAYVLVRGAGEGAFVALVGGLALDFTSGGPFGLSIVLLILVAWIAGLGEMNIFRTARFLPFIAAISAVIAYYTLYGLTLHLFGHSLGGWAFVWRLVLPKILVNLLLTPIVFGLMRWLGKRPTGPTVEIP